MYSSHAGTPPKHEKDDDEFNVDLSMFNSDDDEFSDPSDCCHHIEKMSTSFQCLVYLLLVS
jgi:hypothetical protein